MAGWAQDAVTFEDVAVYLSRAEWDTMGPGQRELYHRVMMENYLLLTSLGYPGPKPDILCRMERGEEPWVSAAQSPVRWDGPRRPSPGQEGEGRWLEEPPSPWWDGVGECPVPQERTQPPGQAGGRRFQWRLRCQRLLRTCPGDSRQGTAEGDSRGAGLLGSQEQIQVVSCSRCCRKGKARGERRIPGNAAGRAALGEAAGPGERLLTDTEHPGLPGEGSPLRGDEELSPEELQEVVWRDHCYCGGSQPWFLHPLREHNYCQRGWGGLQALRDHGYCHPARPQQDRARGSQLARVTTLSKRSQIRRIIRRARRVVWNHKPLLKASGCPRGASGPSSPSELPEVKDDPADGTSGAVGPLVKQEPVFPQPRGGDSPREGSSGGVCTLQVPSAAPSPLRVAVKREPTPPQEEQEVGGRRSPGAEPKLEGGDLLKSNPILLYGVCKAELLPLDHVWDSSCQSSELSGCSLRKIWPISIHRDS